MKGSDVMALNSLDEVIITVIASDLSELKGKFRGELWDFIAHKVMKLQNKINRENRPNGEDQEKVLLELMEMIFDKPNEPAELRSKCFSCARLTVNNQTVCDSCVKAHLGFTSKVKEGK